MIIVCKIKLKKKFLSINHNDSFIYILDSDDVINGFEIHISLKSRKKYYYLLDFTKTNGYRITYYNNTYSIELNKESLIRKLGLDSSVWWEIDYFYKLK